MEKKCFVTLLKSLKTTTKTTVLIILFLEQAHKTLIPHAWESQLLTEIPSMRHPGTPLIVNSREESVVHSPQVSSVLPATHLPAPPGPALAPSPVSPSGRARSAPAPVVVAAQGSCSWAGRPPAGSQRRRPAGGPEAARALREGRPCTDYVGKGLPSFLDISQTCGGRGVAAGLGDKG